MSFDLYCCGPHGTRIDVARAPTPPELRGTWEAKPLAAKGAAGPAGSATLLEFGEADVTDSLVAFWARTDPKPKEGWVLFSWKDGKLTRVLQDYASVAMRRRGR